MKMKLSLIIFNQFKWAFLAATLLQEYSSPLSFQVISVCSPFPAAQGPGTVIFSCQFLGSYPSSIWTRMGKASSAKAALLPKSIVTAWQAENQQPLFCFQPLHILKISLPSLPVPTSSRSSCLSPSLTQGIPQQQGISWTPSFKGVLKGCFVCVHVKYNRAQVLRFVLSPGKMGNFQCWMEFSSCMETSAGKILHSSKGSGW